MLAKQKWQVGTIRMMERVFEERIRQNDEGTPEIVFKLLSVVDHTDRDMLVQSAAALIALAEKADV